MAVGNKKDMKDINSDYVLTHCHNYCRENNITVGELGEQLGHSYCYIQSSCRNGKLPPAELKLLCMLTKMDYDKATELHQEQDSKADFTVSDKLDYIIALLESLGAPSN